MSEIAIKVTDVSKYYNLGVINNGTLFKDIQSYIALKCGKEDPNGKIGRKSSLNARNGFWALKNLNFEIEKGDRVGIIGHNGAGKSTLLKILSGITSPKSGRIEIRGKIASLLEVGTGFHGELTGRENIYMNGAILGMKRSEIDRKVNEIIEFSEIGKHIDTPVKRYSSGMYVRLAFAVAAYLDSDILIADEVLAVGDVAFQKKAITKMGELSSSEGKTVLFVSHNMAAIKQLCNKGMVLEHGKLIFSGSMEAAVERYLNGGNINDTIIASAINHSTTFHLTKILVNGSDYPEIVISSNQNTLEILAEGTTDIVQNVDIMLIFKSLEGVPLASFAIGHSKGQTMLLEKGDFKLKYIVELPKYMCKGECIASIFFHNPNIEGLVDIENVLHFSFEGGRESKGNVMLMNVNGFSSMDGYIGNLL